MSEQHYQCGGQLVKQQAGEYRCQNCGNTVRASVVKEYESFKRVAETDGALSDIATAALEGVDDA